MRNMFIQSLLFQFTFTGIEFECPFGFAGPDFPKDSLVMSPPVDDFRLSFKVAHTWKNPYVSYVYLVTYKGLGVSLTRRTHCL